MKRVLSTLLSLSIIFGTMLCFPESSYAASPIENIYVNGVPIEFSEAERPYIQNDRTMVPLRAIAEALGATVYWFNADKKIQMVRYDTTLRLFIGLPGLDIYKIENGEQNKVDTVELDAPAFQGDETRDYRTFVPARAISEAFGADVNAKFVDNDETKINRAMNVYIVDDYDESKENKVSIAELYDNNEIKTETLISTTGIISKIDSNYYLQDEDEPFKMISLTQIPDVEDFWTEQLGAANNNPKGIKVKITGMVSLEDGAYSMPLRRGSTGIRPIGATSSNKGTVTDKNLFAD